MRRPIVRVCRHFAIVAVGMGIAACGGDSTSDANSSGGAGGSAGSSGGSGGVGAAGVGGTSTGGTGSGGTGAGGTGGTGGTAGSPPATCSGVQCAAGQECCIADGKCFDPAASPSTCVKPTAPGPQGEKPCSAASHCAAGEFCKPMIDGLCLSAGYCVNKSNCGTSTGKSMCGCDGVTYPDVQSACGAGVTIVGTGNCGETQIIGAGGGSAGKKVTYCASSAVCPTGEQCCHITGQCYDTALPALCSFPPPGTKFPCLDNTHCFSGEYCAGPGCSGPGGCTSITSSGGCSGQLSPVCGCDGKDYVNAGCAAVSGVRVDHNGTCS